MSVINTMLRDLEKRQQDTHPQRKALTQRVSYPEHESGRTLWILVSVGCIAVLAAMKWYFYHVSAAHVSTSEVSQDFSDIDLAWHMFKTTQKQSTPYPYPLVSNIVLKHTPKPRTTQVQDMPKAKAQKIASKPVKKTPSNQALEQKSQYTNKRPAAAQKVIKKALPPPKPQVVHIKHDRNPQSIQTLKSSNDNVSTVALHDNASTVAPHDNASTVAPHDNASTVALHDNASTVALKHPKQHTTLTKTTQLQGQQEPLAPSVVQASDIHISEAILTPQEQNETAVAEAVSAERRGDIEQAIEAYQAALQAMPDDHLTRQALVTLWIAKNNYDQAELVLKQGILLFPEQRDMSFTLVKLQMHRGSAQQALNTLINLKPKSQDRLQHLHLQSKLAHQLQKFDVAAQSYKQLAHLQPQQGRWWFGFAFALDSQKEYHRAIMAYQRAIQQKNLSNTTEQYAQDRIKILFKILQGDA